MLAAAAACLVGLTASHRPIVCESGGDPWVLHGRPSAVIVAGLDGEPVDIARLRKRLAARFIVQAAPQANPEKAALRFPPEGEAYASNPESHAPWRWLGVVAPDVVVIAGADPAGLASALENHAPAGVAKLRVAAASAITEEWMRGLPARSEARVEMERRLRRSPEEVARRLAVHYGGTLKEPVYIPAVAVWSRLRLGEASHAARLAEPYASSIRNSLEKATGSHLAGHLLFAELALRTRDPRYIALVRSAADLAFEPDGLMKDAMPLHSEMSDAVFMGCPILAAAGRLTGDPKYFDMALRHLRFMQKLDLRADGLYRHSPLDEAAWGRGNAFPALGLALALTHVSPVHGAFTEIRAAFQRHMEALAGHVDATGMWRQVIDVPGSYPELSATSMIGTAMLRGVKQGWLPARRYRPLIQRAWEAVKRRTGDNGELIDVCTGTGKQRSLRDYLHRPAILGKDPRGGAMVMLFATEMADLP